ncbi:MAG: AI-2E family transporter [Pseudomonadota bacterium]|nr:AI-2E family transporter [Pseudomonadota bacterium]
MPAALSPVTARNALVILAVIVTGAALRWMGGIISPLLLAVFLAVMVDGLARVIRRRAPFLPPAAAILAAIAISVVLFAAVAVIVANNAGAFIGKLGAYGPKLNNLIAHVAGRLGVRAPGTVDQIVGQFDPTPYLGTVAQALQGFASSAVLVLVYLGFIVASRHAFERKMVRLLHEREDRHETLQVFLRVRNSVERYLWIQTITGVMIAVAGWLLMMAVGLENAFFWAFLIFILNYIPIVGAAVAIVLPAVFALVQFDGYGQGALVLGGLFAITFLVGNILLPRMQGDSLNMDPLVVLMSLGFWGAIWGLPGMFLSTPLTVLTMVILAQFEGSRWIAILLSADGDPQGLGRGAERSPDEGGRN